MATSRADRSGEVLAALPKTRADFASTDRHSFLCSLASFGLSAKLGKPGTPPRQEKVARQGEVSSTAPHRLRLEEKLRPKPDAASSVAQCAPVLYQWVGKADELPDYASIIDKWVNSLPDNRAEIRMVERIVEICVKLQTITLREVDGLKDPHVDDIGVEITEDVASGVSEGRAKQLIRDGRVGDEANGAISYDRRGLLSFVDGVQADQLRSGKRTTHAVNSARVASVDANGTCGRSWTSDEGTQCAIGQKECGIEV